MHGVISRRNRQVSVLNNDGPFRMDAVLPGGNRQIRRCHPEVIIDPEAVAGNCDGDGSAGDDQIILRGDSVQGGRNDTQAAVPVNCQIIMGKDDRVGSVRRGVLRECIPAGQAVFRSVREGQENLIRLIDPDACVIAAVEGYAAEHDPDFGIPRSVHDNVSVGQLTGNNILSALGNHQAAVQPIGSVSGDLRGISAKGDLYGFRGIPASVQVILREIFTAGVSFRVRVRNPLDSELFTVHEQNGHNQGKHNDDDANPIYPSMSGHWLSLLSSDDSFPLQPI